ncbi:NAD(P)-binding protein [Corynespora cassiicola Philippines]|uniref:NAD(P)-binding protein n=1 Tax=Corynespora cassiicola Philippines TaxID=1448308 RepID=A0A2T2P6Y4_CORCC|nr:NAD(P)-binding protein [Corynespora cassiicola Philippines]
MSSVVAIAGGSSGLGRAIAEAIKADGRHEPVILSRNANENLEKELGVRFLAADYSSIDNLVSLLQENNINTVIATLNTWGDLGPESNLIHAADKSTVTKRFIPNNWSAIEYKPEYSFPLSAPHIAAQQELAKTSLEWTRIYPGLFLEYYAPSLPTYIQRNAAMVDVDGGIAAIPGTGNDPIDFTYTFDTGRYIAALLSLPAWEPKYFIAGETKTWNQVVEIAERVKGTKFEVHYDSLEQLAKGEVTVLPAYKKAAAAFGGEAVLPMIIGTFAKWGAWMNEGKFHAEGVTRLNEVFPEIKPVGLEEALERGVKN